MMRYRALDADQDYSFGRGAADFLVNTPECVAQAVRTRLLLAQGEWWLDRFEGTPYSTEILGTGTQDIYDQAIKERVLETPGVVTLDSYTSFLDQNRRLTISCAITTLFGQTTVTQVL